MLLFVECNLESVEFSVAKDSYVKKVVYTLQKKPKPSN